MRQFPSREFRDEHGARLLQAFDHCCMGVNDAVPVDRSAPRGRITSLCDEIFSSPRDSMQRSTIMAPRDFRVSLLCLFYRQVISGGNSAFEYRVKSLESVKIKRGQFD